MRELLLFVFLFICSFSLFATNEETVDPSNPSLVLVQVDGVGWICLASSDDGKDDKGKIPEI